jgi:hypothetical protein
MGINGNIAFSAVFVSVVFFSLFFLDRSKQASTE